MIQVDPNKNFDDRRRTKKSIDTKKEREREEKYRSKC
jgi:hypothetical protein